jgi:hypothetical protein
MEEGMAVLKWDTTKDEKALIEVIVDRAIEAGGGARNDWAMDITACHNNGCPLDLEKLAEAPEFDFRHDVFGIRRHLDRSTGKLGDCFIPRCAARGAA